MLKNLKNKFSGKIPEEIVTLDSETDNDNINQNKDDKRMWIRKFTIKYFSEIHSMIKTISKTQMIALIDVKALIKKRDQLDFKRIVKILKERCNETNGDIALLGNWIVLTPSFVKIYRKKEQTNVKDYYM